MRRLPLALAAVLLAWPAVSGAAGAARPDDLRQTFLELINAQREHRGLQPLVLEPALVRAAQAQADDMSARQYVSFSSPEGRQIEDWTREAGYVFQLVTENLATTPDAPPAIAEGWARWPESNRNSLFHPDVRDLGVGIGEVRSTPVYIFVLARSEKSYLDRYVQELYERQTLALQNVEALRVDLLRQINEARAEKKLHPLTRHFALDLAAQEHAEAVLKALLAGAPPETAGRLAPRVKAHLYRTAFTIGERIITDALTPEQASAAVLDKRNGKRSTLLGRGFTQIGIGVAFQQTAEGFRVVWVQCLARPASMPTEADATREPEEGGN